MGVGMARRLKQLQMDKYYGTEEAAYQTRLANKKRAEQYQAALAQRELEAKLRGLSWQQREAQGIGKDDAGAGGLEDEGIPPPPIDIAEEVDEEFSFASMKAMGMNFDDVKSAIEEVKSKASSATDHDLVEGLRRGVGIYDAGLSRTYREAVDFLFRIGYLRVCICSNALALGMNMPCKTSVFAGDAFVLTPTMFKQSGGRAGRRGYDAVGSILFWEVPFNKINRLLEARLPVFSGDFPVTPMLTLRSMRLYEQLENQEDRRKEEEAQVSLQRLFLQPLFCVSADNAKPVPQSLDRLRFYTRFHFRFLCDFLQRLGLLHDGSEETGSGCGLTAWGHMAELSYERETASFFLHFMIYSGIFSEYLREAMSQRGGSVDALSFLMHVLAVCICQEPVTSGQCLRFKLKHDRVMQRVHLNGDSMKTTNEEEKDYEEGSRRGKVLVAAKASEQRALNLPSFRPFLPLLPDDVEAASQAYNDLAFSTSVRCLRGACSVLAEREGEEASFLPEEFCLPYTHVDFSPSRRLSHPRRKQEEKTEKKEEEEEKEKYMRRGASDFFILYERLIKRNVIKSPFCAVTGRTEDTNDFSCVEEIQDTVRSIFPFYPETMCAEVQCNYTWIRHWNEKKKKEVKVKVRGFNSYLLDFLTYKSFRFLTQNNEIGAGRVWYLVADLVRTLELLAKRSPPACVNDNKNNEEEEYRKKNMLPPTPSLHSVLLDLYEEVAKIFKKESA
ncbi:dead deah box helicase domain-containing protein [Cystoisospora suis]|uniref:Dead deah box helicase domain-containing protein n=1 Tax=Cystoisospora suis TaxID=483139 RepID=A0A2C6L0F4_9APIC|nr:dead deah box helicase domain-containing protein [Cystoisospora suis]